MKGTFFNKPLQYSLDLPGESWKQGETITGTLKLESHSKEPISLENLGVHLCFGVVKKLKAKDNTGFELISSINFKDEQISPGDTIELPISFPLKTDCPISENTGSMQIVCGDMSDPFGTGILALKIVPSKPITDFIEIFELFYKFKFKALKNKKDYIEVKVDAPEGGDWTSIQAFTMKLKLENDVLETIYNFKLKKMSYDLTSMDVKDSKLEIKEKLEKKQYSGFGDSPNQEGIKDVISKILDQVKVKPIV